MFSDGVPNNKYLILDRLVLKVLFFISFPSLGEESLNQCQSPLDYVQ